MDQDGLVDMQDMYPNSLSEPHILKANTLATPSWRAWQPDTLQQSHINRITKNLHKPEIPFQ